VSGNVSMHAAPPFPLLAVVLKAAYACDA